MQSALKKNVEGICMTTLFLRNAEQSGFGEMLVEYQKVFVNKDDKYPKTIPDIMVFMRQIPENKRKTNNPKPPGNEKEKEKGKSSLIYATNKQTNMVKRKTMNSVHVIGVVKSAVFFKSFTTRQQKLRFNSRNPNMSKKVTHRK